MNNTFEIAIKTRFLLQCFEEDWKLIGKPLRDTCSISKKIFGEKTVVEISVNNSMAAKVFRDAVFGEKGFLTKSRGWKAEAIEH